ncbi:MAG: alpha/beta fold hydrolase [Chloroflexi bacterium]|nr:alpha/beta fold hydrolase [Chloroflexota bacterium]
MNLGVVFALGFAALATLVLIIAWRGATQLIHPPHRRAETSPVNYQLDYEIISFTACDGFTLRGWFIPTPNPQGTIVVCHGYTGECSPDLEYAPLFHQYHYNTLYFDFRGHGMSDGNYTSLVYYERRDLLAALDFLRVRGIERVGLYGMSMGGAIALATASLSPMVVGVLSDCAFAELCHIVRHNVEKRHVPRILAGSIGWLVVAIAGIRLRANLFSADPIRWVGRIAPRPLLLMQAANDDDVPIAESQSLFAAAGEPKELWLVPNATHRNIESVAREEYRQRVIAFFDKCFIANHNLASKKSQ